MRPYIIAFLYVAVLYIVDGILVYYFIGLFEDWFGVENGVLGSLLVKLLVLISLLLIIGKKTTINFVKDRIELKTVLILLLIGIFFRIAEDPILRFFEIIKDFEFPKKNEWHYYKLKYILIFFTKNVILVPIIEELFFRGFLLNIMTKSKVIIKNAVLYISFLFALIHLNPLIDYWSVVAVFATFVTSLLLFQVYISTKNILSPIIVHSTVNLFWMISLICYSCYWGPVQKLNFGIMYYLIVIICGIITYLLIRLGKMNKCIYTTSEEV